MNIKLNSKREIMQEEIIQLLKDSPSVDEQEVEMWIEIFPQMEKIHFERLREILLKEKL
jgi:ribonucleotide reductase beta subunit family protein with ferritin-like domain